MLVIAAALAIIWKIRRAIRLHPGDVAMSFASFTSLSMALLAIVSVFVFIPIVSEYSFWLVILAYVILASAWHRFRWS